MVNNIKKLMLSVSMALLIAISAQLRFKIGPVPYTMQNFGVMLSGFLLGPKYGMLSVLIYLALVAVGLPFAAGGGGLGVLLGPTAGFLFGFTLAAFLAGLLRRVVWRRGSKKEFVTLWISTLAASAPIYLLGFTVFYSFAVGDARLLGWAESAAKSFGFNSDSIAATLFFATVAIFLPQDFFVDHLLAVIVFEYVYRMIRERGVEID